MARDGKESEGMNAAAAINKRRSAAVSSFLHLPAQHLPNYSVRMFPKGLFQYVETHVPWLKQGTVVTTYAFGDAWQIGEENGVTAASR